MKIAKLKFWGSLQWTLEWNLSNLYHSQKLPEHSFHYFSIIFVSHTLSREILGSEALWPWLLASSGLSALVQLVTLPFFPDSPSYLLIQKGNEEACRKGRVNAFLAYFPSSALSQWEKGSAEDEQGRAVLHTAGPWSTGTVTYDSWSTHGNVCVNLGSLSLMQSMETRHTNVYQHVWHFPPWWALLYFFKGNASGSCAFLYYWIKTTQMFTLFTVK